MADKQDVESKTSGRWTKVEHQKFLIGLELYGKNWKKIEELIGTRTGSQIRSHAQKFFLRSKKDSAELDNESPSLDASQQKNPATVISKSDQNSEEQDTEHSYFLQKIIRASSQQEQLNFWDKFMDMGKWNTASGSQTIKRKDSFVMFDSYTDTKQDIGLPCLAITSE